MGKNPTGKGKIWRRLAHLRGSSDDSGTTAQWERPPGEECQEESFKCPPPGHTKPDEYQAIYRMVRREPDLVLVEFAIILQTMTSRGEWVTFAEVDSTHDDEAHVHVYDRASGQRGDPEHLCEIRSLDDVQAAYITVDEFLETELPALYQKWHHG